MFVFAQCKASQCLRSAQIASDGHDERKFNFAFQTQSVRFNFTCSFDRQTQAHVRKAISTAASRGCAFRVSLPSGFPASGAQVADEAVSHYAVCIALAVSMFRSSLNSILTLGCFTLLDFSPFCRLIAALHERLAAFCACLTSDDLELLLFHCLPQFLTSEALVSFIFAVYLTVGVLICFSLH